MNDVLQACGTFVIFAISATFAQNAVFSRSLGVSRLIKLVEDSAGGTLMFGGLLCLIQVIAAPLAYFANKWMEGLAFRAAIRPLVFILCSAVAFFVVLGFTVFVAKPQNAKNVIAVLPMATFNTAVMGAMLVSMTQNFTLLQTIAFSLGTGIGYMFAVLIVNEGQRKLRSRMVPAAFKGLPITLIYIGILALAIYGFTGHRPSF